MVAEQVIRVGEQQAPLAIVFAIDRDALAHFDTQHPREFGGGRTERRVVGHEQQGPATGDPLADRRALCSGERRLGSIGIAHVFGPECVGNHQNIPFFEDGGGELVAARHDAIAVVGD